MPLNNGQQQIVEAANRWYNDGNNMLFQFEGPPGAGKSFTLDHIINSFGIDRSTVAPAAYTGAAAIVLRTKGFSNAKTLHSWLYNPVQEIRTDEYGNIITDSYFDLPIYEMGFAPKPLEGIKLMIIDEAPMAPRYIRDEIESRGIRTIATGDLRQLPPVMSEPGYLYNGEVLHLTEIMRQQENNPIIYLSHRAYQGFPIHKGYYGNVLVIDSDELTDNMIAMSDVVLCGKNETRDKINKRVRENILHINNDLPQHGERLVCRKNDWNKEVDGISLANGLVGYVSSFPDVSCFDSNMFTIDFTPLILNKPFINLQCDYEYFTADRKHKDILKNNKFNHGAKMEFAYALTTHLAQGSEFSNGIYIQEYLSPEINNRLNFTGVTRFRNALIWVIPKRKYF